MYGVLSAAAMNIDSKTRLGGVPIVEVRDFLRGTAEHGFRLGALQQQFGRDAAGQLMGVLLADGYVTATEEDGASLYTNTLKGGQLARATAARPVARAKAERALSEFLERCEQVRRDPAFLFTVRRAILFGSMLTGKAAVSDIDIAIELGPKENDRERHAALMREQSREAERAGRRFSNLVEKLFWGQTRVRQFLKGRSRIIQLTESDDAVLEQAETRLIFADHDEATAGD